MAPKSPVESFVVPRFRGARIYFIAIRPQSPLVAPLWYHYCLSTRAKCTVSFPIRVQTMTVATGPTCSGIATVSAQRLGVLRQDRDKRDNCEQNEQLEVHRCNLNLFSQSQVQFQLFSPFLILARNWLLSFLLYLRRQTFQEFRTRRSLVQKLVG